MKVRTAKVVFACILAFVALTLLGFHGFSLPAWHPVIDGSPAPEIWLGKPRGSRGDDWMVQLPLALSQTRDSASFSIVTPLAGGDGTDLRIFHSVPVRHWLAAFRPQVAGYFLSPAIGVSWQWWYNVIGLFLSSFLLFRVVTRERLRLSLGAAAAVVFAPFFQFWSFNAAPLVIAFNLLLFAFARLLDSRSVAKTLALTLLATWAGGTFLFFIYPPYQIPLATLGLFIAAGLLWRKLREGGLTAPKVLFSSLAAGLVTLAGLFLQFLREAAPTIQLLGNTAYPGRRALVGGELGISDLFSNFMLLPVWNENWAPFRGNVCEASGFLLVAPLSLAIVGWHAVQNKRFMKSPCDPLWLALSGFIVLCATWQLVGFPAPLNTLSLWSMVPEGRAMIALGLADLLLLTALLGAHGGSDDSKHEQPGRKFQYFLLALWGALTLLVLWKIREQGAGPREHLVLPVAAMLMFGIGWCVIRLKEAALLGILLVSIPLTIAFNPIVRGGTEYLVENPLSRKVLELDGTFHQSTGRPARWLYYGLDSMGNYFRAIGVQAINGTHLLPQLTYWSRLDPEGRSREVYNRYAHVLLELPEQPGPPAFRLKQADTFIVQLHPDAPEFRALGADFLMTSGESPAKFLVSRNLEFLGSIGNHHLFRVRP